MRLTKAQGQKIVDQMKLYFQALKGWAIKYVKRAPYKAQCTWNTTSKSATVYEWDYNLGPMPPDYFWHEMIHLALHAAFGDVPLLSTTGEMTFYPEDEVHINEEKLVRDFSAIALGKPTLVDWQGNLVTSVEN